MKIKNLKHQLLNCNLLIVFNYLCEKQEVKASDINKYWLAYSEVILEMLKQTPDENKQETLYVELVKAEDDKFSDEDWIKVLEINKNYIKPFPNNLKLWGGKEDDENDCPEGHGNINWSGYQEHYALTGINRANYLLNDIEVDEKAWEFVNFCSEIIIAEILWEFTFSGFLEEDCNNFWDKLKNDVDNIKEDDLISWEDAKKYLEEKHGQE